MLEVGDIVEWEDEKRIRRGLVTGIKGDFFFCLSSSPLGSCVARCFVEHVGEGLTYRILNDEELFGVTIPKVGETWVRNSADYDYSVLVTEVSDVVGGEMVKGGKVMPDRYFSPEPLSFFMDRFHKERAC